MAATSFVSAEHVLDRDALASTAQLMRERRSVRRYAPGEIPVEIVKCLLHCASLAPSAHNRQPWRFAVMSRVESKLRVATAMAARLRRDRLIDGDDPEIVEADVTRSIERITSAPVVLLVASSHQDMDAYPDDRRRAAEAAMGMQSTAMAVQNLLLAASATGLGACWMCAPLFCPDAVRTSLDLPPDWEPQGLITLGVPRGDVRQRSRMAMKEFVRWEAA